LRLCINSHSQSIRQLIDFFLSHAEVGWLADRYGEFAIHGDTLPEWPKSGVSGRTAAQYFYSII